MPARSPLSEVFFPVVAVSAIFGMNIRHGLEEVGHEPWLFWLIVLGGLIVGFFTGRSRPAVRESRERAEGSRLTHMPRHAYAVEVRPFQYSRRS